MRQITVEAHRTSGVLAAQLTSSVSTSEHQLRSRKDFFMSNFPTPLEEVIHHNVIKNNKTGGPALDVGQMVVLQVSNADKFVAKLLSCVLRRPSRKGCR